MAGRLEHQARQLIGKNYGVSHETTAKLLSNIRSIAGWLEGKYGLQNITNVKPHMVESYFAEKASQGYAASTMQNHATAWREIAGAVGKPNIVPKTNRELGIERSSNDRYRPQTANNEGLNAIRSKLEQRAQDSLKDRALLSAFQLREAFGLRAKESLMSTKTVEINGRPHLQVEGAKGGRPRTLEIRTEYQARVVEQAREVSRELGSKTGRLIPPDLSLKQFYDYQRNTLASLGASKEDGTNAHAQRHSYAQDRLEETGDRQWVAEELGHGRESVTQHYAD